MSFTVAHGSDWGSAIVKWLALKQPNHCKGVHSTMPSSPPPVPSLSNLLTQPIKVAKFLASLALGFDTVYGRGATNIKGTSFVDVVNDRDTGYRGIQATRPYTLSYGLSDSPVGLLGINYNNKIHYFVYCVTAKYSFDMMKKIIYIFINLLLFTFPLTS